MLRSPSLKGKVLIFSGAVKILEINEIPKGIRIKLYTILYATSGLRCATVIQKTDP